MVPSALPKMFLATSSKQSASSIRDAAAAMVVVGAKTYALSSPIAIDCQGCFWQQSPTIFNQEYPYKSDESKWVRVGCQRNGKT
tara:strand:- start:720 stop:971 length:252 start_codon:yes stop_codon:yes gene_type:complete